MTFQMARLFTLGNILDGAIRRVDRLTWLLLLWPATFLGVHFFYTPLYYYPRHLVAGYLAMGLVAAYVAGGRGRQGAPVGAGPAT